MNTTPTTSQIESLTFGIELETTIPNAAPIEVGQYHVGRPVSGCPSLPAPTFNGAPWSAQQDGSIRGDCWSRGCEFVSPILKGEAGVQHVIEFVAWLNAIGAKVNSSTGCHIHIGLRSVTTDPKHAAKFVKILARLVTKNAVGLYAQTGTLSREQGMYCRTADASARREITRACRKGALDQCASGPDRYSLLNLVPLRTKGTVEFRCFAGTLNISKILAHLVSVFSLVLTAQTRKSLTSWDRREVLSGSQALHNLLKARPAFDIVGAPVFQSRKKEILAKAFEMAARYDAARQARIPASSALSAPAQGGGAIE